MLLDLREQSREETPRPQASEESGRTARRKFDHALREIEKMRRRYLQPPRAKSGTKHKRAFTPGPVLVASSEIVA
jgi:hypothetical protein